MPSSARPVVLLIAGVVVMALASLWAPRLPELISVGGACQFAPCGSLEDPGRWQAAWWLWAAGLAAFVIAIALLSSPAMAVRPAQVVVGLIVAPLWVLATGAVAIVAALFTSVHGAATVAACGLLGPALALVIRIVKDAMGHEPAVAHRQ